MSEFETVFLFETDESGIPLSDAGTVYEVLKEYNWLRMVSMDANSVRFRSINNVCDVFDSVYFPRMIPVGSVEFVEKIMRKKINPILVPDELSEFTGRKIKIVSSKDEITQTAQEWGKNKIFLKSASAVKCDYSDIYCLPGRLPDDSKYFMSEVIDIESEYRCFVRDGRLINIKNYSGNPFVVPNEKAIMNMINAYKNCSPSYTLDVGITRGGETVVIEVHNFIACGLYGFDSVDIIPMLIRAYRYEQRASVSHS